MIAFAVRETPKKRMPPKCQCADRQYPHGQSPKWKIGPTQEVGSRTNGSIRLVARPEHKVEAIETIDVLLIPSTVIFTTPMLVASSILAGIAQAVVDPRIRYSRQ